MMIFAGPLHQHPSVQARCAGLRAVNLVDAAASEFRFAPRQRPYLNAKRRFQSFFMLITVQRSFMAWA